jgi:fucose permease
MFNKRIVFIAACTGILMFGTGLITLGSIASDLRQKFSLDEGEAGILFSIFPVGILAGSLVFGPVSDRYGYKSMFVFAMSAMSTAFLAIAYTDSPAILKFSIFLLGLGGGIINGATSALVSDISAERKGANLSLLGVFFGVGALGMPFILGLLKDQYSYSSILSTTAVFMFLVVLFYGFIRFPLSKKAQGYEPVRKGTLFTDPVLLLIAFFLFFQSSAEAIISNWTTTFLTEEKKITIEQALYGLSLYMAGLTVMRLLIGTVFRKYVNLYLMFVSMIIYAAGILCLGWGDSYFMHLTGLVLIGTGLASGFPVMLGIAGARFASLSGTAFSFVLVIALAGNTIVNYALGRLAATFGIRHLITVSLIESFIMFILIFFLHKKIISRMRLAE